MEKMKTSAQKKPDGTFYTYAEYEKEVAEKLNKYVLWKPKKGDAKKCRSLFSKGYSTSDAFSLIYLSH